MASEQERPVVPPNPDDKTLSDFSTVIQSNLEKLFEDAHTHLPLTTTPSNSSGRVGDIKIVLVAGTYYLYVKVSTASWKRVALS